MARKRMISPTIWEDPTFNKLSIGARLLFIGMFSNADDEGYLRAEAGSLKRLVFGFDEMIMSDLLNWIDELKKTMRSIEFYESEGEQYARFLKWDKYQKQREDRVVSSTYPKPGSHMSGKRQADDGQVSAEVKGSKVKGSKEKGEEEALTPKEKSILFFEAVEKQNDIFYVFVQQLAQQNKVPPESVRRELKKFADYWTETNGTGTKMRWQMEKVFEIRRRLATWFGRVGFKNFSAAQQSGKGKNIIL